MSKNNPKEPIWKVDEKEIDRSIHKLKEDLKENDGRAEQFSKNAKEVQDPNRKAFFSMLHLVQNQYCYSLSAELAVLEWSKGLNRALSQKLQYLDDNTQTRRLLVRHESK